MAEAKADHGQLRRRERQEDAEAVEAREEEDRMGQRDVRHHEQRDRDQRRGDDRLWCDDRPSAQPSELARQLAVLAERIGKPPEARDRGRRRGRQDQRPRGSDEDLKRHAERVR